MEPSKWEVERQVTLRRAYDALLEIINPYTQPNQLNQANAWSQGRASCCARLKELMEGKDA